MLNCSYCGKDIKDWQDNFWEINPLGRHAFDLTDSYFACGTCMSELEQKRKARKGEG